MQEETIKFLTEYRKYRVLWWGFGPTLLEDLCREKKFDVTEFLAKKDKYQCAELLMAFGDRKIYWWRPWSKKFKDSVFDEKARHRALEYQQYSWFWRVVLGLFTSVLLHRQVLKWINIEYGGYMHRSNNQNNATTAERLTADLKTVGGTLNLLGFSGLLQQLDDSLEMVRRNMKTAEQHRQFVAEMDKKMLKSSLKIHPDKVRAESVREEKSEEEIAKAVAEADDKQTALNACRVLIKNTGKLFLDYIHIDFQYGCYDKMKISSLGNMRALNQLNCKFLMKLAKISDIKHEEIITNINKFLKASNSSLESFIASNFNESSKVDFERHRRDALHYLTLCIKGHENLQRQCNRIRRECMQDAELRDLLYDSILNTSRENTQQLNQLKRLKEFSEDALQGKIGLMNNMEYMDEYMVLPFAAYVSTFSVCSIISTKEHTENTFLLWLIFTQFWSYILSFFPKRENQQDGAHKVLSDVMFRFCQDENIKKEEDINKIVDSIVTVSDQLAKRFYPDNYKAITLASCAKELRELEKRIEEFAKQVQEDLARVQKIIQDQDKIAKDQEEIRKDQAEIRGEIQNFEEVFTAWKEEFIQNSQPQPSGSLSGVEPERHSQSMSRD